jgi:hypothetical protein
MGEDRLRDLIASGEFDWDDLGHRVAYLKAWVRGVFSRLPRQETAG